MMKSDAKRMARERRRFWPNGQMMGATVANEVALGTRHVKDTKEWGGSAAAQALLGEKEESDITITESVAEPKHVPEPTKQIGATAFND
jgi:hypothetical protein